MLQNYYELMIGLNNTEIGEQMLPGSFRWTRSKTQDRALGYDGA